MSNFGGGPSYVIHPMKKRKGRRASSATATQGTISGPRQNEQGIDSMHKSTQPAPQERTADSGSRRPRDR